MSEQISYKQSDLAQGIDDLRQAKNAMNDAKTTMQREVTSILGDTWQGPSHEAYEAVLREWDQSMQRMEQITNGIEKALGQMSETYSSTQSKVRQMWA